jgi:hypothetical protein
VEKKRQKRCFGPDVGVMFVGRMKFKSSPQDEKWPKCRAFFAGAEERRASKGCGRGTVGSGPGKRARVLHESPSLSGGREFTRSL